MEQDFQPTSVKADPFATFALISGVFGLAAFCFPPAQLLFGAAAVMLSVLSKKGKTFSGMAKAGLILGIISIILSILLFFYFLIAMQMIKDPANAQMVQEIMRQYQSLFESMQQTPQ